MCVDLIFVEQNLWGMESNDERQTIAIYKLRPGHVIQFENAPKVEPKPEPKGMFAAFWQNWKPR